MKIKKTTNPFFCHSRYDDLHTEVEGMYKDLLISFERFVLPQKPL